MSDNQVPNDETKPILDQIPEALLKKIWNHTGTGEEYQGFYLFYCNKQGEPIAYARTQNSVVDIALRATIEQMVDAGIDESFADDENQ